MATSSLKYDAHQFQRKAAVLHVQREGYGSATQFVTPGLDWSERGGIETHVLFKCRRRVPLWPRDERKVRQVLVRFLHRRVTNGARTRKLTPPAGTTELQLLEFWQQQDRQRIPRLLKQLDALCREYTERKREAGAAAPADARLKILEVEIRNTDAQLIAARDGVAAKLVQIIRLAWLCGWNSQQIGEELKISAAAVRQYLSRMDRIARIEFKFE